MLEKTTVIDVPGLTSESILAISMDALKQLNWEIKYGVGNVLIANSPRSWKTYGEEINIEAADDKVTVSSKMDHGEVMDLGGKNKKRLEEFTAAFQKAKDSFNPERLEHFRTEMNAIADKTVNEFVAEAQRVEQLDKVMNLSTGNMNLTYAIIGINVLVFIAMAFSGVSIFSPLVIDLVNWGANLRLFTLQGEPWRLFTCMFLHIGIVHILLNLYALYIIGSYLERMLGKMRFGVAYVCTGLIASMASLIMNDVVSAGASGAIFGMYGVFLALLTTNLIDSKTRNALLQSIGIFVAYNLIYGFKSGSGVDNAAHLGGLISGFIIGYVYLPTLRKPDDQKLVTRTMISISLATILAIYLALKNFDY